MERVRLAAAVTRQACPVATPRGMPVAANRQENPLLRLQHSIGNRAVQRVLLCQAAKTVQRGPNDRTPPAPPTAKSKSRPPKAAAYDAIISRIASMIGTNEGRAQDVAKYLTIGQTAAERAHTKWSTAAMNYKSAYDQYSAIISKANEHLRDKADLGTILIGIGVGVAVGLIGGAIVGEGAALGIRLLAEFIEKGTEAGIHVGVHETVKPDPIRGNAGIDPYAFTVGQYEKIIKLYSQLVDVARESSGLPLYLRELEALRGQARLLKARASADLTFAQLTARVDAAEAVERGLGAISYPIRDATELAAQLQAERVPETLDFERDIWLAWMSTLQPDEEGGGRGYNTDALDEDVIEDHLIAIGVLGTSGIVGIDTTKSNDDPDEERAIDKAAELWGDLYYKKYLPLMRG